MVEKTKLTSLLTMVIWLISNEYESSSVNIKISGKKQTPCIATMLVKDIYFRSKCIESKNSVGCMESNIPVTVKPV